MTPRTRRRNVHPLARYVIGDYVRVKNSKSGQQDQGVVFGATHSALVRIRTRNGEEVKSLSKNFELIEGADERERAERAHAGSTATEQRQ